MSCCVRSLLESSPQLKLFSVGETLSTLSSATPPSPLVRLLPHHRRSPSPTPLTPLPAWTDSSSSDSKFSTRRATSKQRWRKVKASLLVHTRSVLALYDQVSSLHHSESAEIEELSETFVYRLSTCAAIRQHGRSASLFDSFPSIESRLNGRSWLAPRSSLIISRSFL